MAAGPGEALPTVGPFSEQVRGQALAGRTPATSPGLPKGGLAKLNPLLLLVLPGLTAYAATWAATAWLIPNLRRSGLVQADVHKPDRPLVPELGGLGLFVGIVTGLALGIYLGLQDRWVPLNAVPLLASLATVVLATLIGLVDDLIYLRQSTKALLPVVCVLPLVAANAPTTTLTLPGVGTYDLGLWYPLLVLPIGFTGATNMANMLASFNGLEAGLGVAMFSTLTVAGAILVRPEMTLLAIVGLGACLAFLAFNWAPARVFPGDTGTLLIGATVACAVILGRLEFLALFLAIPFLMDAAMKARHRMPKTFGDVVTNPHVHLRCPPEGPKGLGQLVLRMTGGMTEAGLVTTIIAFEVVVGAIGLGALFLLGGT